MKNKSLEDESLVLREHEWKKILSLESVEDIRVIVLGAKQRRDDVKKSCKEKKQLAVEKAKKNSKLRLQGKAEEFRADLIKNQTLSEKKFKLILKELNIKYEFQKIFYTEKSFYIADFYLNDYNIVIEIDGGYHNTVEQKEKDSKRTKALIKEIDGLYRVKNEAVENIELTKRLIKEFLLKDKKKKLEDRINRTFKKH